MRPWPVLLCLLVTTASAQELRFSDCPTVTFFGEACPRPTPQQTLPAPPTPKEPLFSTATVAPDTPPLLLKLFAEPTLANAQAYLAWQQERQERLRQVQQLLRQLTDPTTAP